MGSHFVLETRRPAGEVVLAWEFIEAPNRGYYWRVVAPDGSISQESERTFLSLEECAGDASRALEQRR